MSQPHTEKAMPLQPAPLPTGPPGHSLYTLYYNVRGNPHHQEKNFWFSGNMQAAIRRTRAYCDNMSFRWIHVKPFFSDLDLDEKRMLGVQSDSSYVKEEVANA